MLHIELPKALKEQLEQDDNLSISEVEFKGGLVRVILFDKRNNRYDYWQQNDDSDPLVVVWE